MRLVYTFIAVGVKQIGKPFVTVLSIVWDGKSYLCCTVRGMLRLETPEHVRGLSTYSSF